MPAAGDNLPKPSALARLRARLAGQGAASQGALQEATERFERAFHDAPIGMALVALDGHFLLVNAALCKITGYGETELLARTFQDITHPDDLNVDVSLAAKLAAGEIPSYQLEKRYVRRDGSFVWILLSVSMVRDAGGEPLYFISQILDISGRKRIEAELQRLADHDAMTGLYNRRRFQEELERQLAYVRRYSAGCAVLVLDLDNLKHVNDTIGHRGGDALISGTADLIKERLRTTDTLGRLGGDEFVVLLPEADHGSATFVADKLVNAVRGAELFVEGRPVSSTVSIGVAVFDPARPTSADHLLAAADTAMYAAKEAGGNRWGLYAPRAGDLGAGAAGELDEHPHAPA